MKKIIKQKQANTMYENKSYISYFKSVKGSLRILDLKSRKFKSGKIISVLNDFANKKKIDLKNLNCLDIGCSKGLITSIISKNFKSIVGIDTDKVAISLAKKEHKKKNIEFKNCSALNLPFNDKSFDVVICNHIYEHVPDASRLFDEIYRVLKKDGFCYLSAGNKLKIIEAHYKLPFLSWLPQKLANYYLIITKRGKVYEEKHFSYWKIKELLAKKFIINDYTIDIIKNHKKYSLTDEIKKNSLIPKLPKLVLKSFKVFIPTYIFILNKK